MRRNKQVGFVTAILLLLFLACGCGNDDSLQEGEVYQIYTVNKGETRGGAYEYRTQTTEDGALIGELLEQLQMTPELATERAAVPENIFIIKYTLDKKRLNIDFSAEYNDLSATGEVLSRAAIVKTLCQAKGVDYVSIMVEGRELMNATGTAVGMMNAEQFVENNGSEINAYERTVLKLYFADKEGDKLRSYEKELVYNSNISMEKLVVEQMVIGPESDDGEYAATINPATKVISVTVRDGTCYINLDSSFLNPVENISPELTIYSVVNALTELTNVNKVQFSIDGETDVSFMETVSLSGTFEKNYEIME